MNIPALVALPKEITSRNMRTQYVKAGFVALTDSKYINGYSYLLPGDILLYESHHAATNITQGKNAIETISSPYNSGSSTALQTLEYGMTGSGVQAMQIMLLKWDAECLPHYGADGEYGSETKSAIKAFQKEFKLPQTGVCDEMTLESLIAFTAPSENYREYIVRKGDSLWKIAKEQMGNGSKYPEIKSLNNLSSDLIRVGQILKIPEV